MKSVRDMIAEQRDPVTGYRRLAERVALERLAPLSPVIGVLLTGSVARGDARKGPFGLQIDITVVVTNRGVLNVAEAFGPSVEPFNPYHCVEIEGQPFAFEVVTMEDLTGIRNTYESVIFAKNESAILFDRTGQLAKWKTEAELLSNVVGENFRASPRAFVFMGLSEYQPRRDRSL